MKRMTRRNALRIVGAGSAAWVAEGVGGALSAGVEKGASMVTRKIPSSDETVPVIGLGTWQTFDIDPGSPERRAREEALQTFADLGGKVVDTSPMYGRSEEVLGEIMATLHLRERVFLATKVWTSGRLPGIRQMEESMRKLRADRIDLMQVHNLVDASTHLDTLRGWKREGRIRYLGITHYTAGGHEAVAGLVASQPLDFIQINYSVGEREAEEHLLPLAMERGVAVIANRPFAGGELFARLRGRPLPGWAAEINGQSWAQLLLKFVISNPAITCAVPATSKVTHLRDNMQAGHGNLPDEKFRARIIKETV